MKKISKIIALISLIVLIAPSFLYMIGKLEDLESVKWYMLLATIVWFIFATIWMWKDDKPAEENQE